MNNTTYSPMNDWIILLVVAVVAYFIIHTLAIIVWKVFKFLFRKRKAPAIAIDMTNVISINQRRKRNIKAMY